MIVSELLTPNSELIYAQDDYLEVKGDTRTDTLTFSTFPVDSSWTFPSTPVRGEVFYNFEATRRRPYYYDGIASTPWKEFGVGVGGTGGDRYVATQIVAASNSLDISRADWTCDGTDDQQEINKAIHAMPASGGAVYLLEGTYNISDVLLEGETLKGIVPHTKTAIIGAGAGTVLRGTSGTSYVIQASSVNSILVSRLRIDGSNGCNTGIRWTSVTNSKIDKVCVENMSSVGIRFRNSSSNNIISNSKIQGNYDFGIEIISSCENNIITGNNIQGNGAGIHTSTFYHNIITGNNIQGNTGNGITFYTDSYYNIISGNNIQGNGGNGIILNWPAGLNAIFGNNIQGNDRGIYVFYYSDYNNIFGNNIQGNDSYGIYLLASKGTVISGNVIYDNGGASVADGIASDASVFSLISYNLFYDSADGTGNPIYIADNSRDNYLVGNYISSYPAGYNYIYDAGTNNQYTDKVKMTLQQWTISTSSSSYTLDVATNPRSYVYLIPSSNITSFTLKDGKSAGDLLIIGNGKVSGGAKTITINEASNVNLGDTSRPLGPNDTLKLIWNGSVAEGGTGKWLEMAYVDN